MSLPDGTRGCITLFSGDHKGIKHKHRESTHDALVLGGPQDAPVPQVPSSPRFGVLELFLVVVTVEKGDVRLLRRRYTLSDPVLRS